ncbi:hypothetical protein [Caballeronia glebae]|uniref:hypothetical protein n=1 Tax=Caballeronia glebae TaxID=1777143 RepID=UPI0038B9F2DB
MSTSSSQLQADIAKLHADVGLMHSVIHGPLGTTVTTEGGPVLGVADAIHSITQFTMRGQWATSTQYNFKDLYVDATSNIVYMVVATHVSSTIAADLAAGRVAVYQGGAFLQYGAGASLRTPQDKMRDYPVSPEDFFAAGDGVTDDTTAIRNAVIASARRGLRGRFGKTYRITTPQVFGPDDVWDSYIDMRGCTILVDGPRTIGTEFDFKYAALTFMGEWGSTVDQTLAADAAEGQNDYVVDGYASFAIGDFWKIQVAPDSTSEADHIVDVLARVVDINTGTKQVYFDHVRAYAVVTGSAVRFTKANPVRNVSVDVNVKFNLAYAGTDADKMAACSGVAFYCATRPEAIRVDYARNPKIAAWFGYCWSPRAIGVSNYSPIEVTSGGYGVQFANCLFPYAEGLRGAKDRHILDFTASHGTLALECWGHNTSNSSFTSHGKWESNMTFLRCVGHLQFAGSAGFGSHARNIVVDGHVGTILNAQTGITDLTIRDSRFSSIANINVDGLVIENSTFGNEMVFFASSMLSQRENKIENSYLNLGGDAAFPSGVNVPISFYKCRIDNFTANMMSSYGKFRFFDCDVSTPSTSSLPSTCAAAELTVVGGTWRGASLLFQGTQDQQITFDGVTTDNYNRPSSLAMLNFMNTGGTVRLSYRGVKSNSIGARHVTAITTGATFKGSFTDTDFVSGSIRVDASTLGASGWLRFGNNTYEGVTRTLPAAATNVVYSGEVTL